VYTVQVLRVCVTMSANNTVHTTRVHRPSSRPVNTGVKNLEHGGVIFDTCVYGP